MTFSPIHAIFDLLAATCAAIVTVVLHRWRLRDAAATVERAGLGYAAALLLGAAVGGFGFGTLNLRLSHLPDVGRSVLGALAGAIAGVEIYKRVRGIHGSTGLLFVPAFATTVAVGRWGCYFAGLADPTYGIPTALPWGHDFGDGVPRHPVQIYESLAMTIFLACTIAFLARRSPFFLRNGFYVLVLYYSAQRFLWEFLKPYGTVLGPFNAFHFVAAGLVGYALAMMRGSRERVRT